MEARPLTSELSVSDQISASDADVICAAGYKVKRCDITLNFGSTLSAIDRPAKRTSFILEGMLKGREWLAKPEIIG